MIFRTYPVNFLLLVSNFPERCSERNLECWAVWLNVRGVLGGGTDTISNKDISIGKTHGLVANPWVEFPSYPLKGLASAYYSAELRDASRTWHHLSSCVRDQGVMISLASPSLMWKDDNMCVSLIAGLAYRFAHLQSQVSCLPETACRQFTEAWSRSVPLRKILIRRGRTGMRKKESQEKPTVGGWCR